MPNPTEDQLHLLLRGHTPRWLAYRLFCIVSGALLLTAEAHAGAAEGRILSGPNEVVSLVKQLKSRDPVKRRKAAEDLRIVGREAEDAVPALLKALDDGNIYVRIAAARALGYTRAKPEVVVPGLCRLARNKDPRLRDAGLRALLVLGPLAKDAVPFLVGMLKDRDTAHDGLAIAVLGRIGPPAKDAVTEITKRLNGDKGVCLTAVKALANMGSYGAPAVPTIKRLLRDEKERVRKDALEALARIGFSGRSLVPDLKKMLFKTKRSEQVLVANALLVLEGESVAVMAVFSSALKAKDIIGRPVPPEERRRAIEAVEARSLAARLLSEKRRPPKALLDDIIGALETKNSTLENHLVRTLGKMGSAGAEAVPALMKKVKDKQFPNREAMEALGKIGPAARAAVPALLAQMEKKGCVEPVAVVAYWRITGDRDKSIPLLLKVAVNPKNYKQARLVAIEGLGLMGSGAMSAVPELKKLLKGESPTIRRAAREALRKIQ